MGRSQETFGKKEKEKKKRKKRQEKEAKRAERKAQGKRSGFENMIAYVDEFGQVTDTPPDPTKRVEIKLENIEIGVPKREKEEIPTDRRGRVDHFDHAKGYGFIKEVGSGDKFFVHITGCIDDITEGNNVIFEVEQGAKGLNAVRVKKA